MTDARRGHLNEPAQMPDDWTETGVGPAPAYILVVPGHSAVWACKDVCAALEELASEGDQGLKLVGQVREGRV